MEVLLLICALYLRVYTHYLAQWLYLQWLRVPVYQFEPTGYSVNLKYVGNVLPMEYELGAVIWGPLGNLALFGVMAFISYVSISTIGTFPETLSRFVAFFGIAVCLDPVLIAIVDVSAGNYDCLSDRYPACQVDLSSNECDCYEGDAFKLYFRFLRDEGSGIVGIIMTVFIYVVLFMLAAFGVYAFLLHLHMDGRMLDLYRRLHSPEESFTLPHDMEVSARELQDVVGKAKRWRGPKGT